MKYTCKNRTLPCGQELIFVTTDPLTKEQLEEYRNIGFILEEK